jgi:hypothetical protein
MSASSAGAAGLANHLNLAREIDGDRRIHHFGNGLVVHTDPFLSADPECRPARVRSRFDVTTSCRPFGAG